MPRLTKQEIRNLLENDTPAPSRSPNKKVGSWSNLDAAIKRAVGYRKPGEARKPSETLTFTRTDSAGGRAVVKHGQATVFDVASKLKGAKEGHASAPSGEVVFKKQHSSVEPTPYYRQLREASKQWIGEGINPSNIDPFYDRYKKTQIAVASPPKIKRVPSSKPRVLAAPKIQNASVDPTPAYHQLKESWWCGTCNSNEDTMTGDIGSVAVPFVAPGETEEERQKKRKKRRKLGVIMAVSTGSVQGTGN